MAEAASAVPNITARVGKRARSARTIRINADVEDDIVRVGCVP